MVIALSAKSSSSGEPKRWRLGRAAFYGWLTQIPLEICHRGDANSIYYNLMWYLNDLPGPLPALADKFSPGEPEDRWAFLLMFILCSLTVPPILFVLIAVIRNAIVSWIWRRRSSISRPT